MINVLITGIAGASLGTEILKSLRLRDKKYSIYGCDISPLAYGHYCKGVEETFLASKERYEESILDFCLSRKIKYIIPGGEQPNVLLSKSRNIFTEHGIEILSNSDCVIDICTSKNRLFEFLGGRNIVIPKTFTILNDLKQNVFPLVVKPSEGSGGSNFVYVARDKSELNIYKDFLLKNNIIPTIQEYIPHHEGEFTVGVLSSKSGSILSAVALKRLFHSKLSVSFQSHDVLISSGYTQGIIDEFPSVIETCEIISKTLGSTGPLNIQGRLKGGDFIPFEINPRFSASTFLRSLANVNEVDFYLRNLTEGETSFPKPNYGYYMRSFEEMYIPKDKVLK